MRHIHMTFASLSIWLLCTAILATSNCCCSSHRVNTRIEEPAAAAAETLIAILPFQDYTADPSLDWIGRGIGASLTTILSALQGFRLVERQRLDLILQEQKLQSSDLFDPETVVETGKLWNTRYLLLGGYQKLGDFYRLDGWRVDTRTGQIFDARGITGKDLFALQEELGGRLREAIDRSSKKLPKSPSGIQDIEVAVRVVETIPTSVYHLLKTLQAPLVEYTIENTASDKYQLFVSTEIAGYTLKEEDTVELPGFGVHIIHHTPTFQSEKLTLLTQERSASMSLSITASIDGASRVIFQQQRDIKLLPYNMLLWSLESADGQRIDLLPAIAAWVSPNSSAVARLLREAVDYNPSHRIAGYQNPILMASPDSHETQEQRQFAVREEVRSIYQMLQELYQLRYIDQSTQYPSGQGQRILLPEEALDYRSANCIDGTVLIASLLYRAGIHPIIIIVPGHAFLGWEVWPDTGHYDVLETTQLGTGDFDTALAVGWKQAEIAGIAAELRQGIQFGREGERSIGQAILLDIWTLKERNQLVEIPFAIAKKQI